jgi:hypothetical protein
LRDSFWACRGLEEDNVGSTSRLAAMLPAEGGQTTSIEASELTVSFRQEDCHPVAGLLRVGWDVCLLVIRIMSTVSLW